MIFHDTTIHAGDPDIVNHPPSLVELDLARQVIATPGNVDALHDLVTVACSPQRAAHVVLAAALSYVFGGVA